MIASLLFWMFKVFGGMLFVLLSSVLLYRRLFSRWVKFAGCYSVAYAVGSWTMFGELPWALTQLRSDPKLLGVAMQTAFFVAPAACLGYGLYLQLSRLQIAGILLWYFACLVGFLNLTGLFPAENIASVLISLPFLGFWIGTPLVLGWGLWREAACGTLIGLTVVWTCLLAAFAIVVTNYFGVPFAFFYELSANTKALIDLGLIAAAVLGIPFVVGYGWMHDWGFKTTSGALTLFLVGIASAVLMVTLTIGWPLFSAASR